MTSLRELKRDLEIVLRALNVNNGENEQLQKNLQILKDYQDMWEVATKDMTLEEKTELNIQEAEEAARMALEMARDYDKVFNPAIKGYRLVKKNQYGE